MAIISGGVSVYSPFFCIGFRIFRFLWIWAVMVIFVCQAVIFLLVVGLICGCSLIIFIIFVIDTHANISYILPTHNIEAQYEINLLQPPHRLKSIMIKQALHQIHEMSQKIQTSVQRALNQTTKQQFLSPDTHHQSHPNTNSHPTKQYHKKHEKSSSQPQPILPPSEPSPSHIRHFMLQQQNSLLKQQVKQLKNKQKLYRQEVRDLKKYIKFLQQYNDGLKKQVVVWMTRPVKKQLKQQSIIQQKLQQYRGRFNQILAMNHRSSKQYNNESTNYNSISYEPKPYGNQQYQFMNPGILYQQRNINGRGYGNGNGNGKGHSGQYQRQAIKIINRQAGQSPDQSSSHQSESQQQSIYQPEPMQKQLHSKSLILPTNKRKQNSNNHIKCTHNVNNPQTTPQCTSCNYLQYQKYRNKFMNSPYPVRKNSKTKSKNNNNRTSISHHNSRYHTNNNKTLQLRHDHIHLTSKNKPNTMNREQTTLQQGRKKNSLCECHEQYIKNRYK